MECWTEIARENVGVTHVDGHHVIFPIGDVAEIDVRDVEEELVWRESHERFVEEARAMRRDMEQKRQARERIEEAGYEPDEIPI